MIKQTIKIVAQLSSHALLIRADYQDCGTIKQSCTFDKADYQDCCTITCHAYR